jgi:hypothetical protein
MDNHGRYSQNIVIAPMKPGVIGMDGPSQR